MICITGFETFGGFARNTSQEILQTIQRSSPFPETEEITALLLPVEQKGCFERVRSSLETSAFSHIFLLGMAVRSVCLSVEKVAINWAHYTIPDNAGQQPLDEPIIPDGPAAYFSTFPVTAMIRHCTNTPLPVQISLSAGSYVCNDLYYRTLHWNHQHHSKAKTVFIHLPAMEEPSSDQLLRSEGCSFEAIYQTFLCLLSKGLSESRS